jgi:hypothetical protein
MKLTESNSVNLDKPLAEGAVAPGECGSVPDEPSDDESLIACLGDDAAKLMQANPGDEMATTMLVAAIRISQLLSRMQPPNNQPNSDHVAVIGAKSDSVHLAVQLDSPESRVEPEPNRKEHNLKVWPGFYDALESGEKTFELRHDDRGYRAGDVLLLREWSPNSGEYTGRQMRRKVSYIISGLWGLQQNVVCMALQSGISSPSCRPNEKDVVGEGK